MVFSEAELRCVSRISQDERKLETIIKLLSDYEDDIEGLRAALENGIDPDDNTKEGVYSFDPTLIILLIKFAPLAWELLKSLPNIIALIKYWRTARQTRRRKRRE
jgi:hypothetical protein